MKKFLSIVVALAFALSCFGAAFAADPKAAPATPVKPAPAMDNAVKKEGEAKPAKKKAAKKKKKAAKPAVKKPEPTAAPQSNPEAPVGDPAPPVKK